MRRAHNLQTAISHAIKGKDMRRLPAFTGITNAGLLAHLESQFQDGMSWDNYGRGHGKWQVDHIVPKTDFHLDTPGEMERCFHFTNLRPRWSVENSAYVRSEQTLEKMRAASSHRRVHPPVDVQAAAAAGIPVKVVKWRIRHGWSRDRLYEDYRPRRRRSV